MNFKTNPVIRILIIILLGVAILKASSFLADLINQSISEWFDPESKLQRNFSYKVLILIFSLMAMFILGKGKLSEFGFRKGDRINYKKMAWLSFLISIGCLVIVIIFNIIHHSIHKSPPEAFEPDTFINTILFVWLWSSICEEVLTRGLMQGYLMPLANRQFKFFKIRISLPVLITALFFSGMHSTLLSKGMSPLFVSGILVNTFILGIVAGWYREKSRSLIPAILIHIIFNIGGSLPIIIKNLISLLEST